MDRRKTFAPEMSKTAGAFRAELGEFGIEAYWEAFQTETDQDFAQACRRAREECDFMPTIKALRQFLPDRRARAAVEATDRYLRENQQLSERLAPWPRRIEPEPTPVAELVAPYLERH
jgi:hypothetical protein